MTKEVHLIRIALLYPNGRPLKGMEPSFCLPQACGMGPRSVEFKNMACIGSLGRQRLFGIMCIICSFMAVRLKHPIIVHDIMDCRSVLSVKFNNGGLNHSLVKIPFVFLEEKDSGLVTA